MAGIATVTMLPSRTVISIPVDRTPRAVQRERRARAGVTAGAGGAYVDMGLSGRQAGGG